MPPTDRPYPDPAYPPGRGAGGGGRGGEFPGPILSGRVPVPSSRDVRRPSGRGGAGAPPPGGPKPRRRRRLTRGQKLLRALIILLTFLLVIAAAGYGYFRYEWAQITTAPCPSCTAVTDGAPYNVLVIGSDTRAGETASEAQQFGNQSNAGGQRSDTIKIIHVDPQAGTASTLSIPRDTFVTLSGVPASSGVSTKNKINSAFASGPNDPDPSGTGANGLVQTIENTFGIPISHWIVVNFFGLMDAVTALGGVNMNVPYPVKDYGACNGNPAVLSNCTGLNIPTTGCQTISGAQALALSRSRHFEWYQNGEWHSDESSDIGRIERQNLIIEAVVNKAKSTYNPITAASFISSLTHDVTLDNQLSANDLLDLANKYHAFSGSSLTNFTLPTTSAHYAPYGEDVQVVQQPEANQMITQFLGAAPTTASTPPLDQYGEPVTVAATTPASAPAATPAASTSRSSSTTATTQPSTATTKSDVPAYDPVPC